MPLSPLCRARNRDNCLRGCSFTAKFNSMFGRSKLCRKTRGSLSKSRRTMSARVALSAVAVKAITCAPPSNRAARPSSRYSGRKSCPHSEMQCASSMARRARRAPRNSSIKPSISSRSGETNSNLNSPARKARRACAFSAASFWEFSVIAATPSSRICCTWSRIRAISGETTTVRRSSRMAGNW